MSLLTGRLTPNRQSLFWALYAFCFAFICVRVGCLTWLEEDGFITLRVIKNFENGFGFRYNIHERVQAYTNPLWMLLHLPLNLLTENIMTSTLLLSWLCLAGSLVTVTFTFRPIQPLRQCALFLIPILVSPTLTLYFTSGLEQPLVNVLFAFFGYALIRRPRYYWFWLSLTTALSLMTRLDAAVFYGPIWLYLLIRHWKEWRVVPLLLGSLPLAGWLLFSLFYYGFILPNTAPSKLWAGIPLTDYIDSGLVYMFDFAIGDPWCMLLIVASLIYMPYQVWKTYKVREKDDDANLALSITVGILCYCLYIIYIGGYILSLRMYALPAFAAVWLWLWRYRWQSVQGLLWYAVLAVSVLHFALSKAERIEVPSIASKLITGFSWSQTLLVKSSKRPFDYHVNREFLKKSQLLSSPKPVRVALSGILGQGPFFDGPYTILIDPIGLSDALLARLPAASGRLRIIGHINRKIPKGYVHAVETGSLEQMDPDLAKYYEKLRLIISGDLWDKERLKTIILFNLGYYDSYRDTYIKNITKTVKQ
jgi:arabinofuranosyltransferase